MWNNTNLFELAVYTHLAEGFNVEKESKYAIILGSFFSMSLVASVVLFSYLESHAEVVNPTYRLGGAIAGFFVIFVTLCYTYSKLIAKPPSEMAKEAARAITKPRGFREYKSSARGFLIYYPKEWEVRESQLVPPVFFERGDGPSVNIVTDKAEEKLLQDIEKDASAFSEFYGDVFENMFKDCKVLEKSTIALHGVQCPMYAIERKIKDVVVRQVQIAYLDVAAKKIHWMTFSADASGEYEDLRPLFQKMISTFRVL